MTEKEWIECREPDKMLEFLRESASERKLRLFVCACCRGIWHLLVDQRSRRAVEVGECFADAPTHNGRIEDALTDADRPMLAIQRHLRKSRVVRPLPKALSAAIAARLPCWGSPLADAVRACVSATHEATEGFGDPRFCDLLQDIFGNPFCPSTLNPVWRTPIVLSLAREAYDNRTLPAGTLDHDLLFVLSDALEDAGCDNTDLLNHLREQKDHVRGCWALDAILGKK